MMRWSLSISLAVILAASCVAEDKKPVPPKKPEPEKELKPEKKTGDDAPKPPASGDDEEAKILERLKNNSRSAEERLAKPDTGDATRKLQDEVLKDIDELIKRLKNPPPPQQNQNQDQNQNSQSGGGGGGSSSSSSGGSSSGSQGQQRASGLSREQRRQMREQRRQQQAKGGGQGRQPMGGQQPQGGQQGRQPMGGNQQANAGQGGQDNKTGGNTAGTQGGAGGRDPKGINPAAEMYKDVWGHLPDKMRQEMDSYFKEKFMPKYNDLLKQYYSNIAEQNKKK